MSPNPLIYSASEGIKVRAPDVPGYRCLSFDEVIRTGDVWGYPYGDGAYNWESKYRPFNPESAIGGSYVGQTLNQQRPYQGFCAYRKLAPGEMVAAGGSSSAGNEVYARPTPLP